MGGASGWMNNDIIQVTPGEIINIVVGNVGESTSFGTYLSANGGSWDSGGAGGHTWDYYQSRGYQFGGGVGADGGPWGGGGGGYGGDGADAINGSGGGGYGKQSVGRYGGGGYYCPGGGKRNTFGGRGIGVWTSDGKNVNSFLWIWW